MTGRMHDTLAVYLPSNTKFSFFAFLCGNVCVFFNLYLYTKSIPKTFSSVFRIQYSRFVQIWIRLDRRLVEFIQEGNILVIALDDDTNCRGTRLFTDRNLATVSVNRFKSYPEHCFYSKQFLCRIDIWLVAEFHHNL